MSEHTKAALILCGFAALVMHHFSVDLLTIIYVTMAFLLVLRYSDVNRYRPWIDHVTPIIRFQDNILVAPILLCVCVSIALGVALIALWVLWFPVVNPMIDEGSKIIDEIITWNMQPDTLIAFAVLFSIIAATQVFRIGMDKLSSGVRRR